jgi:hypothetical protein
MQTQTPFELTALFVALAVVVAVTAAWGVARSAPAGAARGRRFALSLGIAAAWMALWALVARSGALLDFARRPPPMLLLVLATLGAGQALGWSRVGARLASGLPLAALVGFQAFRLPLELVMHGAANAGVMPQQMTFTGWNFDIVTGASAIVVAGLVAAGRAPRALVLAWNVLGMALLINIVVIAVVSTPLVQAFGSAPAQVNTWIGVAPFSWLPTVFVVAAMAGHVAVTRRLLHELRGASPALSSAA